MRQLVAQREAYLYQQLDDALAPSTAKVHQLQSLIQQLQSLLPHIAQACETDSHTQLVQLYQHVRMHEAEAEASTLLRDIESEEDDGTVISQRARPNTVEGIDGVKMFGKM